MAEQRTKKQHTVPQFYLRALADAKERLFVFDKIQGRAFSAAVKDVAQKRAFYDIPREHIGLGPDKIEDFQVVERALAEREALLSRRMRAFLGQAESGGAIDQETRFAIAYFMAIQTFRTPLVRSNLREIGTRVLEHLGKNEGADAVAPGTPLFEQLQLAGHDFPVLQAQMMLDPNMSAEMMAPLVERIWCVGVNRTSLPLYTSDNPVVWDACIAPRSGMGFGVGSNGVLVALPLSPKIVLLLWDRNSVPEFAAQEGKRLMLTVDSVVALNSLQVTLSERQIFCSSGEFALAEALCRERPDIRDPRQQRIWVS